MKSKILIVFLISTMFLGSCGIGLLVIRPISRNQIQKSINTNIPPDLGKENTNVIFLLIGTKYDKYIKKRAPKFYLGKQKFMTIKEAGKLTSDTEDVDRFIFSCTDPAVSFDNFQNTTNITPRYFYIYDRLENKKYQCSPYSSLYVRVMEAYLMEMENYRISKQK